MKEKLKEARMWHVTNELRNRIAELEAKLADKETEIKEIHHRVKNNFQTVASVLNMGARATKSDKAKEAIQSARSRVMVMASVYEQLQSTEGQVSMRQLATGIVSQYGFVEKGVSTTIDIPEDVLLPAEQAVPCAQIINGLVSNSFKYAFPDGRQGGVKVAMQIKKGKMSLGFSMDGKLTEENDEVELIVSDDGVGLPEDFNLQKLESMGMTIVRSLTEQIDGSYNVGTNYGYGTKFTIRFEI